MADAKIPKPYTTLAKKSLPLKSDEKNVSSQGSTDEKPKHFIYVGKNLNPSQANFLLLPENWQETLDPVDTFALKKLGMAGSAERHYYTNADTEFLGIGDKIAITYRLNLKGRDRRKEMADWFSRSENNDGSEAGPEYLEHVDRLQDTEKTAWIPLINEPHDGISLTESAEIVTQSFLDVSEGNIHLSLPQSASVDQIEMLMSKLPEAILIETDSTAPPSQMPDQLHSDHPVKDIKDDDLGRNAIAQTIARNASRVWPDQIAEQRPFAVHLSGRWGSGKSTILNFLETHLIADTTHFPTSPGTISPPTPQGWVTVKYNAWQMQDSGPPWWSLRNAVADQGYKALGPRGYWLRVTDWCWRRSQMLRPWLWIALALFALTAVSFFFNPFSTEDTPTGPWSMIAGVASSVAALGALLGLLSNFTKSATEKAEAIRTLHSDPTAVFQDRFAKMVKNIERPVAVFIDDLDRCDAQFVVDLLQSLQTAYAKVPVLYVVASDRDWIVSAYNQVYKNFQPEVAKPGLPLGYLFVKKIFQLSVAVPDLVTSDTEKLTKALLEVKTAPIDPTEIAQAEAAFDARIQEAVEDGDMSELSKIGAEAKDSPAAKQVAAKLMNAVGSDEIQKKVRHALIEYVELMDGNPRALKRLINAITFRQGYILMAGENIDFDVIARWTILCLRFPYTSDQIAADPDLLDPDNRPEDTTKYFHDDAIDKIIAPLTHDNVAAVAAFG